MAVTHYYLIRIQYLGFRYSGWQKQPGVKTIEGMLVKTLKYILPGREFKVLGSGRTDAKVSALEAAFELYLTGDEILNIEKFLQELNHNLPPDIKAIKIVEVNKKFNIISDCIEKEYVYLFSYGQKNHPFSAPFIVGVLEELDIALMNKGASLFKGTHNFKAYTPRTAKNKQFTRTVTDCFIKSNDLMSASFFPEQSYALVIRAQGFLRYQVRMIMGVLFRLGRHEINMQDIESSLEPETTTVFDSVAPGSGLMLNSLTFDPPS